MTTKVYRLSGTVNPRGEGPAICVPAFNCVEDNYIYTQYVGIDNKILSFDLVDFTDAEQIKGAPKALQIAVGDPAIYWVTWSSDHSDAIYDKIEVVRKAVIDNRWIIDKVANPFERLDFAQLSGQYTWFAEEAKACEAALDDDTRDYWLRETLCLSRVRFAIDSVLFTKEIPFSARHRISVRVNAWDPDGLLDRVDSLCRQYLLDHAPDTVIGEIRRFLSDDVIYRYAVAALLGSTEKRATDLPPTKWYKKITRSDAQRKKTGNQRGGITLVKAGFPVSTQTYFRQKLFTDLDWVLGKTRKTTNVVETASVRMRTTVLGRRLGTLSFSISYAPNRVADQNNYTTLFHLGPLSEIFNEQDMTGKWLSIERAADGLFSLVITHKRPA